MQRKPRSIDSTAWFDYRVRILPEQLERARRRVRQLEQEAARLGLPIPEDENQTDEGTDDVKKPKLTQIWCDHCNAEISVSGVRSCLRKDCKTKALLPDARKVLK